MATLSEHMTDPKKRGKLLLALQRAICSEFNSADWKQLGYESGQHDYIQNHTRLLRSLNFGDEDYGDCVFQALEHFVSVQPDAIDPLINNAKLREQLIRDVPDIVEFIHADAGDVQTEVPTGIFASDIVLRALADADHLLRVSGPVSAVDRLHTALHGYFRTLCTESGIQVADDIAMTALFKALRADHPALKFLGSHDKDMIRILNGFANAVDALNTLRNNGSIAHPSGNLPGEPEALLAVNATRTIFNYVRAKVGH